MKKQAQADLEYQEGPFGGSRSIRAGTQGRTCSPRPVRRIQRFSLRACEAERRDSCAIRIVSLNVRSRCHLDHGHAQGSGQRRHGLNANKCLRQHFTAPSLGNGCGMSRSLEEALQVCDSAGAFTDITATLTPTTLATLQVRACRALVEKRVLQNQGRIRLVPQDLADGFIDV